MAYFLNAYKNRRGTICHGDPYTNLHDAVDEIHEPPEGWVYEATIYRGDGYDDVEMRDLMPVVDGYRKGIQDEARHERTERWAGVGS